MPVRITHMESVFKGNFDNIYQVKHEQYVSQQHRKAVEHEQHSALFQR